MDPDTLFDGGRRVDASTEGARDAGRNRGKDAGIHPLHDAGVPGEPPSPDASGHDEAAACAARCPAPLNASPVCPADGGCDFTCLEPYGDCNTEIDGCESRLDTKQRCGDCNMKCSPNLQCIDGMCL